MTFATPEESRWWLSTRLAVHHYFLSFLHRHIFWLMCEGGRSLHPQLRGGFDGARGVSSVANVLPFVRNFHSAENTSFIHLRLGKSERSDMSWRIKQKTYYYLKVSGSEGSIFASTISKQWKDNTCDGSIKKKVLLAKSFFFSKMRSSQVELNLKYSASEFPHSHKVKVNLSILSPLLSFAM